MNKQREKIRKRLLLDDISNLFNKFKEKYPRTQTKEIRPKWGIPVQQQSQEVCKCIYHENIDLICISITNFSRSKMFEIDYKLVSNTNNIWKATLCYTFKEKCVWRKYENC